MLRECLGSIVPLHEAHIHRILKEGTAHYNRGRPRSHRWRGIPEFAFSEKDRAQVERYHNSEQPAHCGRSDTRRSSP